MFNIHRVLAPLLRVRFRTSYALEVAPSPGTRTSKSSSPLKPTYLHVVWEIKLGKHTYVLWWAPSHKSKEITVHFFILFTCGMPMHRFPIYFIQCLSLSLVLNLFRFSTKFQASILVKLSLYVVVVVFLRFQMWKIVNALLLFRSL